MEHTYMWKKIWKKKISCFKDEKIQGVSAGVGREVNSWGDKSGTPVKISFINLDQNPNAWQLIVSIFKTQYNLGKCFQPTVSPIPGTE